jgi:hypothetical protein
MLGGLRAVECEVMVPGSLLRLTQRKSQPCVTTEIGSAVSPDLSDLTHA